MLQFMGDRVNYLNGLPGIRLGRNRYWDNSAHTFAQDNLIWLGATHHLLNLLNGHGSRQIFWILNDELGRSDGRALCHTRNSANAARHFRTGHGHSTRVHLQIFIQFIEWIELDLRHFAGRLALLLRNRYLLQLHLANGRRCIW